MKQEETSEKDLKQETLNEQADQETTAATEESAQEDTGSEMSDLEKKEIEYKELNDRYLRLYSEFDNFRKRTQKERIELIKTAGEDILKNLLPVIDDFERAQKAMEEGNEGKDVAEGVKLIYQKLLGVLKQQGVEKMESAIGKPFDSDLQEAITQIPAPSKKLKGKVVDEIEHGYLLKDKVIRYAKVVVGQ